MKEPKGVKRFLKASIIACSILPFFANAQEIEGTISVTTKLTEDTVLKGDITLENKAKLLIESGEITIDLNGFTISQTNNQYSIDNMGGMVTIKNGKVKCTSQTASCIRNYKETNLENLEVDTMNSGLKNEEGTVANIKNCIFHANGNGGTIQNFGKVYMEDSSFTNISDLYSTAILAGSYADYDAEVYAKNCTFNAKEAVQAIRHPASPSGTTCNNAIIFDGGTFLDYSVIRLNDPNSNAKVEGIVTGPARLLEYAIEGTELTLNEDVIDTELTIPKGVIVKVPDTITFKAKLNGEGNILCPTTKVLKNLEDGTVVLMDKADYTNWEEIVAEVNALEEELYTEESFSKVMELINQITEDKSIEEQTYVDEMAEKLKEAVANLTLKEIKNPEEEKKEEEKPSTDNKEEEKKPDVTVDENPKTIDNIIWYLIVAMTSMGTLVLSVKKCLD